MSGHTTGLTRSRRLTQLRSRTTPGSYEAPVEGIVDYGAFSAGFEKGIAPGLAYLAEMAEEEEMPDLITLEDFDYTGTASKSGALGVSTEASNSMNLGIDNKIRDIQARLDSAVIRKDVNLQRDIMREYNTLKKVVAGAQTAFGSIAGGEGAIDARQARNIKIGRNAKGEGLSWYDISTIGNQKDSTFEFVTNADGTGGLRVNGYYFDTTSINENSVSKITPLLGGLDAAAQDFNKQNPLAKIQRTKETTKEGLTEKTTSKVTEDSYTNIDTKAKDFSKVILNNDATKNANLLDFMYGEGENVGSEPTLFMQSLIDDDEFKEYETKYNLTKEETFRQITQLLSTANNSLTAEQLKEKVEISTKIIDKGAQNYYKLNIASEAYVVDPDTGRTVRRDDLVNKKQLDPEGPTGGLNINIGGIGVSERTKNLFDEVNKFGSSDEVYGSLFKNKQMLIDGFGKKTLNQERLTQVTNSSSGTGREKLLVFDTRKNLEPKDKPSFVVYDFGYSMQGDAPDVFVSLEGKIVPEGTKDAIKVSPQTVQDYMQGRIGATSGTRQADDSKEVNDVLLARKQRFEQRRQEERQENLNLEIAVGEEEDAKLKKQDEIIFDVFREGKVPRDEAVKAISNPNWADWWSDRGRIYGINTLQWVKEAAEGRKENLEDYLKKFKRRKRADGDYELIDLDKDRRARIILNDFNNHLRKLRLPKN